MFTRFAVYYFKMYQSVISRHFSCVLYFCQLKIIAETYHKVTEVVTLTAHNNTIIITIIINYYHTLQSRLRVDGKREIDHHHMSMYV